MNHQLQPSSQIGAGLTDTLPAVCTTREVAELLGVSLRTVQLWVDGGVLEAWRTAGGHRRIMRESVAALLEKCPDVGVRLDGGQSSDSFLVAQQPVMDRDGRVLGCELFYRSPIYEGEARFSDSVKATSQVIRTVFGELGFLGAIGDSLCFLNVDAEVLAEDLVLALEPSRVVLELSADIECTDALLERCIDLKRAGFRLSLEYFQEGALLDQLLPLADFVKIDFCSSLDALRVTRQLESISGRVKLIAGRVETQDAYRLARDIGCDYFQGFYFARPEIVRGKQVPTQKAVLLDLLRLLLTGNVDNQEIERRLKLEPALCFGLLKLANSAGSGMSRRVGTLKDVLLILGRQNLVRWVQLLLYSSEGHGVEVTSPLLLAAAFRGRFLECLVALLPGQVALRDKAFMVGLLSFIDTLLGVPLEQVLMRLSLPEKVERALLARSGLLGELLSLAIALDTQDFGKVDELVGRLAVDRGGLLRGMVDSLAWSNSLVKEG